MTWVKRGLIHCPRGEHGWDRQYAHLPTAHQFTDATLRIYFAALDENRYGRIGYADVSAADPSQVFETSRRPVLDLGDPGTFDDAGVNPSCLVRGDERILLFYIGWQRTSNANAPYMLFAGAAETHDGVTFRKLSRTPILDRTSDEPFIRSAMTVIDESGRLRCWYVSALQWSTVLGAPYPEYVIRYAESTDGLHWKAYRHVCIPIEGEEFGIGRPWVLKDGDLYRMWYSIRSRVEPYRIGYAESRDGLNWARKDSESTVPRSESGWDSEMICYPCVADAGGNRYLFYNGNRHGSTGFGYAVAAEPA